MKKLNSFLAGNLFTLKKVSYYFQNTIWIIFLNAWHTHK